MFLSRKATVVSVTAAFSLLSLAYCEKPGGDGKPFTPVTSADSISYMIGYDVGRSLKALKPEIRFDALLRGMQDNMDDKSPAMTDEQMRELGSALNQRMQAKQQQEAQEQGDANLKKGEEFLAKNKIVKGVSTTASGLQYSVVKKGTGAKPVAADKVTVHYKGTTLDGKEFDSSYKRGEPASFSLANVIPGWTEGLQLMAAGSTYKFWIPAKLGYGERSPGPGIGPNEMLIFEVELLSIDK